jgi:hypothetical protein
MHGEPVPWVPSFTTTTRLLARSCAASADASGGVAGSSAPEISSAGTADLIGEWKSSGIAPLRPFATSSLILAYLKVAEVSALGFAPNCGFGESGYVFRADHRKAHAPVESLVNGISHQQNCLPIHRPIVLISAVDHGGERAESVEQWAQLCDKHAARKGYGLGCSGIAVLYLEMGGGLVEAVDDGRELFLQIGIGFVANIIGGKVTTMAGCVELRRVSLGAAGIMERATISISWMNQAQITV